MQTNTYLNFPGNTEEAFRFYAKAFGGELEIVRFSEMPMEGVKIRDADEDKVLHVALPLPGGQRLMGSDALESLGQKVVVGNNTYTSVHVDSREEADALFAALSAGGKVEMGMDDMPWGDYFGAFSDRFGVQWMVSHTPKG